MHTERTNECAGHVDFRCGLGDAQGARDFLIGFASCVKVKHFLLPPSEVITSPPSKTMEGNLLHLLPVMQHFCCKRHMCRAADSGATCLAHRGGEVCPNAKDILVIGHQTFRRLSLEELPGSIALGLVVIRLVV